MGDFAVQRRGQDSVGKAVERLYKGSRAKDRVQPRRSISRMFKGGVICEGSTFRSHNERYRAFLVLQV